MKHFIKTALVSFLMLGLLAPSVYAQEASTSVPSVDASISGPAVDTTLPQPQDAATSSAPDIAAQPEPDNAAATTTSDTVQSAKDAISTALPQDTAVPQQTIDATEVLATGDPQIATTTDVAPSTATSTPVVESSTTPEVAPVAPAEPIVVAEDVALPAAEEQGEAPQEITAPRPARISVVEKPRGPTYRFSLSGHTLPAKRVLQNGAGMSTQEEVTQTLTSTVDNTTGSVTVSGTCTGAYYVVLLYAHPDDYATDRRSYLVNRAYPCTGGTFTYSISELPSSLSDGTYYLLAGEEGAQGVWKPITALTEVIISRNK